VSEQTDPSPLVPNAPAAKHVEVNGVRLQYVEHGSGEPIVFVHGALQDLRAWEPVREEIAKRYRSRAMPRLAARRGWASNGMGRPVWFIARAP